MPTDEVISVSLSADRVRRIGDLEAYNQALDIANSRRLNGGAKQLASQTYYDATTHRGAAGDMTVVFTFKVV
jgi:hypothetical protein